MKRYLSLALILLMLPALLAVPVNADSYDWYQLLDYGGVNGTANTFYTMQQSDELIYFNTPGSLLATEIEILVYSIRPITGARIARQSNSSYETATVTALGDNIYRIHLDTNRIFHSVNLRISYDGTEACQLQFFSVRVSIVREISDRLHVEGIVYDLSDQASEHPFVTGASGSFTYATWTTNPSGDSNGMGGWDAILHVEHDNNYQYVDVAVLAYTQSIDSIKVVLGEHSVPFTVSKIVGSTNSGITSFSYIILVDLSNISHNDYYTLDVRISGHGAWDRTNQFAVTNCWGHYGIEEINPLAYFFASVHGWFDDQTSAIAGWGQSLKDSIDALPDKIAEALKSVFVPSDSVVQDMGQQSEELAQDRFGGAYEGALIIDEFASQLRPQQATQILTVPVVNLDILGVPFPLGGWEVDLVPDGAELIVETCKILIDIVATLAFVNGLRNRLERTLEK